MQKNRKLSKVYELLKERYNISPRMLKTLKDVYPKLNILNKHKSVFLHGKAGTGKTIYALGIVTKALKNIKVPIMHNSLVFITISELLVNLKHYYGKTKSDPNYGIQHDEFGDMTTYEERLINKCKHANFLILDDFGVNSHTPWSNDILLSIIDYRYNQMKNIIVTSNLNLNELASSTGDDRIVSRLSDMCDVVLFKKQYRKL